MEKLAYSFTVIDRSTNRCICKNESDVVKLKEHVSESLFNYIKNTILSRRLAPRKLMDADCICIIFRHNSHSYVSDNANHLKPNRLLNTINEN